MVYVITSARHAAVDAHMRLLPICKSCIDRSRYSLKPECLTTFSSSVSGIPSCCRLLRWMMKFGWILDDVTMGRPCPRFQRPEKAKDWISAKRERYTKLKTHSMKLVRMTIHLLLYPAEAPVAVSDSRSRVIFQSRNLYVHSK